MDSRALVLSPGVFLQNRIINPGLISAYCRPQITCNIGPDCKSSPRAHGIVPSTQQI